MNVNVTLRKWGNSLGAVFPKKFVEKKRLHAGDNVTLCILHEADLSGVFGKLKTRMTGQQFKDMVRDDLWGVH